MSGFTALRSVAAIRYVTPLREGGSLPGLVEADDDGLYVVKFRGAGQGLRALVAEVIVGELARRTGLLVPELVEVELDPVLGAAEPDPEIQDLITGSAGSNLGVDFLPGSLPYTPGGPWMPDARLAADVVWLDALTTNVDRTPRNPNLLIWHDRMWLIDHGAALYLQHGGLDPAEHFDRPRAYLDALVRVAQGDPECGPIATLPQSERFGWLVAPSSTIIQPSRVHTGLSDDPQATLDALFAELVEPVAPDPGGAAR
jgi:Protein of unknown function (DUF3037)/HipA-like kinase